MAYAYTAAEKAGWRSFYQVLGVFTVLFCFASVFSSLYLIWSAYKIRRESKHGKSARDKPFLVTEHVLWMAVCDAIFETVLGVLFIPVALGSNTGTVLAGLCPTLGFLLHAGVSGSCAWNFVIGLTLFRVLCGKNMLEIQGELLYHHGFVWLVTAFAGIAPIFSQDFGFSPALEQKFGWKSFYCWMKKSDYRFTFYGPLIFYMFFSIVLLVYVCIKAKDVNNKSSIKRMVGFTIFFVISWFGPFYLRVIDIFSTPPESALHFATIYHHIGGSLIGVANATVWLTTSAVKNQGKGNINSKTDKSVETTQPNQNDADV